MKVTWSEHDGCFAVDLEAETLEEAAQFVRFGINRTSELRGAYVYANAKDVAVSIVIGKRKQPSTLVRQAGPR